jgi:cyclophilin family peptidyl-prolyl cis-trans isomerase
MSSLRRITVPILALAAVVLVAGCGGGKKDSDSTSTEAAAASSPADCASAPKLDASKTTTAKMETSQGTFSFSLDAKDSPNTTAAFACLVKLGFYDGLTFHRVVPGFVIQGGDPSGDGTGGPGFTVVDTPPGDAKYTKGVVAMAKTGAEPAGSSGSQFFVVSGADAGLPPEYALLGNVTDGIDVVEKIDALGTGDGPPSEKVTIDKVTLSTD